MGSGPKRPPDLPDAPHGGAAPPERVNVPLAGEDRVKLSSLQGWIAGDLEAFEARYDELLSGDLPLLQEICDHLKLGQGKRFRPMLLLITARDGEAAGEDALFCAACVELVHTATLVHDDFIDEAELRRGLPTVNAQWGPSSALIMGDFLYSKVFALLTGKGLHEAMAILGRTTHSMSIAEMMQLESRGKLDLGEDEYLAVITRKTASLIEAACELGALQHPRLRAQRQELATYGRNVGLAFQVTDDVLDYTGDRSRLGKPVGGDWREGRITLPFIAAWQAAPEAEKRPFRDGLADGADEAELWPQLRSFVERHGGVDYANRTALSYGQAAKRALDGVEVAPQRDILTSAADYVLGRLH